MRRDDVIADTILVMVDVIEEHIEGAQPLLQARLNARPFASRNDPGNDVERPGAIDILTIRIHRERNAHFHDGAIRGCLSGLQAAIGEFLQVAHQRQRDQARSAFGSHQFVVMLMALLGRAVGTHRLGIFLLAR